MPGRAPELAAAIDTVTSSAASPSAYYYPAATILLQPRHTLSLLILTIEERQHTYQKSRNLLYR
jgi:hypothetical protein